MAHASARAKGVVAYAFLFKLLRAHGRDTLAAANHLLAVLAAERESGGDERAILPSACGDILQHALGRFGLSAHDLASRLPPVLARMLRALEGAADRAEGLHGGSLWSTGAPMFATASLAAAQPLWSNAALSSPLTAVAAGVPPPLGLRPLPHSFERLFHEAALPRHFLDTS